MSTHVTETDDTEVLIRRVDAQVLRVAAILGALTFADMGGTFALQIDLGNWPDRDTPGDAAGIDPEPGATWWVDFGGGTRTEISDLGLDASPETVAAWIRDQQAT